MKPVQCLAAARNAAKAAATKAATKAARAAICAAACLLLTSCATLTPQEPTIELADVRPLNLSLSGQRLAVTLNVINPNSFDLNLQGVDITATLAGEPVATGSSDNSVTIPADGEQTLELVVTAGLDVALARLRTMLSNRQTGLDYGVSGTVRLSDWPVPIPFQSDGRLDNPLTDPADNSRN